MNKRFFQFKFPAIACLLLLLLALSAVAASPVNPSAAKKSKAKAAPAAPTNAPVVVLVTNAPPAPPPMRPPADALVWDAMSKDFIAKLGDTDARFTFYVTNQSEVVVVVSEIHPACGCTTAQAPPMPWKLAPGEGGEVSFKLNLAGKTGTLIKTVRVSSTSITNMLMLKAVLPDPALARAANMELAKGDRQAVFKDNCISCHVTPTIGKMGKELYDTACGICHESANRATMVTDLRNLKHPTDRDYWRVWTANGKPDTLMPAFAKDQGGPLTEEQIDSLADYLTQAIPSTVTNSFQ